MSFDSATDNEFHVYVREGRVRSFKQSEKGLYYSDLRDTGDVMLINTVEYNKSKYSQRDYLRAVDARKLQHILDGPSYGHFRRIMKEKQPRNCLINEDDVRAAEYIFGPSLQILKGRTTKKNQYIFRS